MNENKRMSGEYDNPTERDPDGLTPEQRELAESSLPKYQTEEIPAAERRGCGREVYELQDMFEAFESTYSIAELLAITDLTPAEAPNHPLREPARQALIPIVTRLNILKEETNISTELHDQLKARYKYLSRAVGFINNNKVRH